MYKQFYMMEKEPFDIHPSPELFYKSNAHQNGWGYLFQGIKSNEPILLVTGEYGTGKTLLCLRLVQLLKALKKKNKLPSVYLSTPTYDFTRVLEKIIVELNIPRDGVDTSKEFKLQQLLYDHFEAATDNNKNKYVYLVIDDAQDFNYSFINKLRLLCSYNVAGEFPIRLILFAHQDFFGMLNDKRNAAMAQRIRRIYRLNPFELEETREYIYFRLTYSGASGAPVFDDDAIELIQKASRGVPRLINNICDNCLLVASNERLNEIDAEMVTEAMEMGNMVAVESLPKSEDLTSQNVHPNSPKVLADEDMNQLPRFSEDINDDLNNDVPQHGEHQRNEFRQARENREYRNEQAQVPVDYEDDPYTETYEKEVPQSKKINKKSVIWDYAKKGMIVILVMVILFLLFYIFMQNNSSEKNNLQGANDQTNFFVSQAQGGAENLSTQKTTYGLMSNLPSRDRGTTSFRVQGIRSLYFV